MQRRGVFVSGARVHDDAFLCPLGLIHMCLPECSIVRN